jgi:hypothetical protein
VLLPAAHQVGDAAANLGSGGRAMRADVRGERAQFAHLLQYRQAI